MGSFYKTHNHNSAATHMVDNATVEIPGNVSPETLLLEAESKMAALLLNLQSGIIFEQADGRITQVSKGCCDMFGIPGTPEELAGYTSVWLEQYMQQHVKEAATYSKRIEQIRQRQIQVLGEELHLTDGRILERDYVPILVQGLYAGCMWKFSDISARKKFDRELKRQEEKYHNIIANMNLGLLEVDQNDVIQNVNDNFCAISGYDKDYLLGKKSWEIFLNEKNKNILEHKNKLNKYGIIDIFQTPVINKRGEERWWMISDAPIYAENGDLKGLIGIHLDISEQKKMEKELEIARQKAEESSKAKETFLANMSHEIRTPLNAIIGMIRELAREQMNQKQQTYLNIAGISVQHLLSLINNILDMSKIGAGEFQLENRHFNLRDVVAETASIVSINAKEKMLDLNVVIAEELAHAFIGDPTRIRQILINLAGNAIKFTKKGAINIECHVESTSNSAQNVLVSIIDTGIGMDRAYLKNLFTKFTQEDRTIARNYGGTGLGMAITYELVQLMGGRIIVDSEKGKGTRVDIYLPLIMGDASKIESEPDRDSFDKLNKIKLLLVEDNEMNRLVATNTLSQFDIHITEAENGFEAIEKLKAEAFDVILMDLQMPVIDGLVATRIIRNVLKINTPIIALSANAFKKEIDLCIEAGMNDYVTKPFEENMLLRTIIRNIGKEVGYRLISKPKGKAAVMQPAEKLYDLGKIMDISRGNDDFVKKMITMFIAEVSNSLQQIKTAYKDGDYATLYQVAHRIKPSILNMDILSIKKEIQQMEVLAHDDPHSDLLPVCINKAEVVLVKVLEQLAKELE